MTQYLIYGIISLFITIIILAVQNSRNKLILIEKNIEYRDDCRTRITTLLFGKKLYKTADPRLIDDNHFFVPIKGKSLFVNRKIIRKETKINGSIKVSYTYNGYEELTVNELRKVFETLKPYLED